MGELRGILTLLLPVLLPMRRGRRTTKLCFSLMSYKMAGWTGLEPATFCVTGRRSNQLSYHPVMGRTVTFRRSQLAVKREFGVPFCHSSMGNTRIHLAPSEFSTSSVWNRGFYSVARGMFQGPFARPVGPRPQLPGERRPPALFGIGAPCRRRRAQQPLRRRQQAP